jgi:hypothetical protein
MHMANRTGTILQFRLVVRTVRRRDQQVTVAVSKNELKLVLEKLDAVKLELLRLRAMLLPEEEATEEEKKEIEEAKKEIAKGSKINLEDLIKETGC